MRITEKNFEETDVTGFSLYAASQSDGICAAAGVRTCWFAAPLAVAVLVIASLQLLSSAGRADEGAAVSDSQPESATTEVTKFVDSWTNAFIVADTEGMMKHYADRKDLRVAFSSGRELDSFEDLEAEYEASFADGVFLESKLVKPVVRRMGNTAWVHGQHRLIMKFGEDPQKYRLLVRTTLVLERINDQWKVVLEHSSTIENVPRIQPALQ